MSTINEYVVKLDRLANSMDIRLKDIILKNEGKLLSTIKLRLFQKSLDGDYNFLGTYALMTKKRKKAKGQISNRVTLRDTGDWYNSMFIDFKNNQILVDASDNKTDMLKDIYGDAILQLADEEIEFFVDSVLDPELQKMIDDLDSSINIDI